MRGIDPPNHCFHLQQGGLYIHTEIACSAVITLEQDEIPDELHAAKN